MSLVELVVDLYSLDELVIAEGLLGRGVQVALGRLVARVVILVIILKRVVRGVRARGSRRRRSQVAPPQISVMGGDTGSRQEVAVGSLVSRRGVVIVKILECVQTKEGCNKRYKINPQKGCDKHAF